MHIDARGMRCPWPAVRLARALRSGATWVEIVADDPNAPAELAATAAATGASFVVVEGDMPTFRVVIPDRGNTNFT